MPDFIKNPNKKKFERRHAKTFNIKSWQKSILLLTNDIYHHSCDFLRIRRKSKIVHSKDG